jgi:ferredoxin, 2Fe-2S
MMRGLEMPRFNFISASGERVEIETPAGTSAMRVAVVNGLEGILAECGGALACGTCHVYVEPSHLPRLSPPDVVEDEMLDMTASERRPNSRLSCQIVMSEALDGLVLHLPERQE